MANSGRHLERSEHGRMHAYQWRMVAISGLVGLLAACSGPFLGIMSGDERTQMALARGVKNTLVPSSNRALGICLREVSRFVSAGLPSRYGLDLRDYLVPFGALPPVSPGVPLQVVTNPATGELARLASQNGLWVIDFEVKTPSQETASYAGVASRTPFGATGRLDVVLSGSNWGPGGGAPPYLNRGFAPQVPSAMQVGIQLVSLPQGAGQASAELRLGNFQPGGDRPVPQQVGFSFALPGFSGQYTGAFSTDLTSVRLAGTTTFRLDRGSEDFATVFTSERGGTTWKAEFTHTRLKVKIDLQGAQGKLAGVARAMEWRFLDFATLVQEAGKPLTVRYADGSQESVSLEWPGN